MKALLALALVSSPAFAYTDGTYRCGFADGLGNTYKIETIDVGGHRLPYIESTIRYRKNPSDKNSPVLESFTQGLGTLSHFEDGETITLNYLHLEFVDGQLAHCKQ